LEEITFKMLILRKKMSFGVSSLVGCHTCSLLCGFSKKTCRAFSSGTPRAISRSNRPALRSAGSNASGLFEIIEDGNDEINFCLLFLC
jgi:hypothetical protein